MALYATRLEHGPGVHVVREVADDVHVSLDADSVLPMGWVLKSTMGRNSLQCPPEKLPV